jgi:phosphoglycolate phosphatase-like HAD superfamily hydrolase
MAVILLDLDGTLLDVSQRLYTLYSDYISSFNLRPLSKEIYLEHKRNRIPEESIAVNSGLNTAQTKEYLYWRNQKIETNEYLALDTPFSDCIHVLKLLNQHFTLYLVTLRKNRDLLQYQLHLLGLDHYFQKVLMSGESGPAITVKANMVRQVNDPLWIIGDTDIDILCGKKLNINTIGITTGLYAPHFLQELSPDFLVDSLMEALQVILKNNVNDFNNKDMT